MAEDIMPPGMEPPGKGHAENDSINRDGPADLDAVADRLEAALERIAARLDSSGSNSPPLELAARLDGLIGRLREVLGTTPTSGQE